MPDGPPLLKECRHLRKDAAGQLWRSLQVQGWKPLKKPPGALLLNLKSSSVVARVFPDV